VREVECLYLLPFSKDQGKIVQPPNTAVTKLATIHLASTPNLPPEFLGMLPYVSPAITAVVIVFAGTKVVLTETVPLGPYNPGICAVVFASFPKSFVEF